MAIKHLPDLHVNVTLLLTDFHHFIKWYIKNFKKSQKVQSLHHLMFRKFFLKALKLKLPFALKMKTVPFIFKNKHFENDFYLSPFLESV